MVLFICGSILIVLSFIFCAMEDSNPFIILMTIVGVVLIAVCISDEVDKKYPKAIDVYRGNTTLKISYVDSVATDSVVVFKNKK